MAGPLPDDDAALGERAYRLIERLFPLGRSLTGAGVRQTLAILREAVPELRVHEVPSGTPCFDWTVPLEWTIRGASITGPDGRTVVDYADHTLHVVGYSVPVDCTVDLEELQGHLHSVPDRPDAIPYVTSYYERTWGFCLSQTRRDALRPGPYRVRIDSTLAPGHMTCADLRIPGESADEVLLSSYLCHPSMANNELSGPVVATLLARWLLDHPRRRRSYRIVLGPERIGAIHYLSRHRDHLRRHVVAGFNLTCVGDDRTYSLMPTRRGTTLTDRVAQHVLGHLAPGYRAYPFTLSGSDERQYCSPGIDLPVASVMRSKYREYPEYHTSDDDLSLVSPAGLAGAFRVYRRMIECLERNRVPIARFPCVPRLGDRGLYPKTSGHAVKPERTWHRMNLLAYADGEHDLLAIAELLGVPLWELADMADELERHDLIRGVSG